MPELHLLAQSSLWSAATEWMDRTLITTDFARFLSDVSPLGAGLAAHLGFRHLAKQRKVRSKDAAGDEARDET